ncbi:MAG: OHCU decarboxylase [Gammaproteobacteria bacterium HGW-Gammaproteobacteria-4]|jgi:OHCU decarboxylase|nr:MAG: OHCU decarboxylase [Gammaproteobacteria bacterium HGW-Gammaproteobacteria-4]
MTLDQLNQLDHAAFVATLGGIFEHSPWVAERVFAQRPFAGVGALHEAMCAVVDAASAAEQLALIRAHPQLAGKAAVRKELTAASLSEQQGAGLGQCSPDEFARITELNDAYQQRFGFPFILAVRGHTRDSIIAAMAERIDNPPEHEHDKALRQIARIARFRLADLIQD